MSFDATYREEAPTRDEVDASQGLMLLEFGANWCGICQGLSPAIKELLEDCPQVRPEPEEIRRSLAELARGGV